MRLLTYDDRGELNLTDDLPLEETLSYAILSHTWGEDRDEVKFQELNNGLDKSKAGYRKLQLCDTCCIDKSSSSELSENINLMFKYYQKAAKFYVYLSDIDDIHSDEDFKKSMWFTRGWTLQKLLAPRSLEFFSRGWKRIGERSGLEQIMIQDRNTKKAEDRAYCLLGIFGVSMLVNYGEGESAAFVRLENKIKKNLKPTSRIIDGHIREYYLSDGRLDIERLSGQLLPMESCFINLALVNILGHNNKHSDRGQNAADQAIFKSTLSFRLKVDTPQISKVVTLEALFERRKLIHGMTGRPKRVVIWGQAGMGKTTLCKKIAYSFLQNHMWQCLYDRIFWLPLRRLKMLPNEPKSVGQMVHEICFHGAIDGSLPLETLHDIIQAPGGRCLFILDGFDEVSHTFDDDSPAGANLQKLLKQEHVIITSRPHVADTLKRMRPDLEFETVGFFPEQVKEFLRREAGQEYASQKSMSAIRSFIERRPLVKSLIRIPIQLDAVCFAWDQEHFQRDNTNTTMTMPYQTITDLLWQKDFVRLGGKFRGEYVTSQQIRSCNNIRYLVEPEISCLEELAFAGLYGQFMEFSAQDINAMGGGQVPLLDSRLTKLSFLRSSDSLSNRADQTSHFIHFTFQEFFAAQYFVRHWPSSRAMVFPKITQASMWCFKGNETIMPTDFIQKEKYNPRYNIFWRFVTGLLKRQCGDGVLDQYFQELQSEPYDYLGLAHQLLIIHCLNEVVRYQGCFDMKARDLEHGFRKWVTFASSSKSENQLLMMDECPNSVLKHWLHGSEIKKAQVIPALIQKPSIPFEILNAVINEAQKTHLPNSQCCRVMAVILKHYGQLPEDVFSTLFAAHDVGMWLTASRQIPFEQALPPLLLQIRTRLLQHSDTAGVNKIMRALRRHHLPEIALNVIIQLLRNSDIELRSNMARILAEQKSLPDFVIEAVIQLLRDGEPQVRYSAADALKWQHNLPKSILMVLVELLQDEVVQSAAAHTLRQHSDLTGSIIEILAQHLRDRDSSVRMWTALALEWQNSLHSSIIEDLVQLLPDQDMLNAKHAASSLVKLDGLSKSVVKIVFHFLQNSHRWARIPSWVIQAISTQIDIPLVLNYLVQLMHDRNQTSAIRFQIFEILVSRSSKPPFVIEALNRVQDGSIAHVPFSHPANPKIQSTISDSCTICLIQKLTGWEGYHEASDFVRVLECRAEFYKLIPSLNSFALTRLLNVWSEYIVKNRYSYVIFHNDVFLVEIDGKRWMVPIASELRAGFRRRWLDAREMIGMPPILDNYKSSTLRLKRKWTEVECWYTICIFNCEFSTWELSEMSRVTWGSES